jgi:DNA-binding NtrC family response regulator
MAIVLIVDDEARIRQVLARWITAAGHDVREAWSADGALANVDAYPAAVVFCDIQMPGRDGLWLTAELRTRHPTTAVVLATGISTVPPRASMQSGVLAYLVKPFSKASVMDALDLALEWHLTAPASPARIARADLQSWLDSLQ